MYFPIMCDVRTLTRELTSVIPTATENAISSRHGICVLQLQRHAVRQNAARQPMYVTCTDLAPEWLTIAHPLYADCDHQAPSP